MATMLLMLLLPSSSTLPRFPLRSPQPENLTQEKKTKKMKMGRGEK